MAYYMPRRNLVFAERLDLRTFEIEVYMEQLAVSRQREYLGGWHSNERSLHQDRLLEKRCYWDHGVSCSGLSTHGLTEISKLAEG